MIISSPRIFKRILCRSGHIPNVRNYIKPKHPFKKTWDVLFKNSNLIGQKTVFYPEHADVVIIGGGLIGSAVAYWLKTKTGKGLSVVVIEKDLSFKQSYESISLGNISQHYSLPENVCLSQYGIEFLRNSKELLNRNVDVRYHPSGCLVLAGEEHAEKLEKNVDVLREHGVKSELVTPNHIREKFPWINTRDIALGCMSYEGEGYFDARNLFKGLIQKSLELGTIYVNSEVIGFEFQRQHDLLMEGVKLGAYEKLNRVVYRTSDNEEYALKFAYCVLAAGTKSADIAKLARVGTGEGLLSIPLPVERRDSKVFTVSSDEKLRLNLNTPVTLDTSGLWFRKNGFENSLICGLMPVLLSDTNIQGADKGDIEETFYNNLIKPLLVNRVPQCEKAKIKCVSTEKYDYNRYDDSGIIGPHPYYYNLIFATGLGMNGALHALGAGRAIAEMIIDRNFETIDVTRFGFDRFLMGESVVESNVY